MARGAQRQDPDKQNYTAKVCPHDMGRPEESSTTTQTNKSYTAMVWPHDISGPEENSTTTQTNIKLHSVVFERARATSSLKFAKTQPGEAKIPSRRTAGGGQEALTKLPA